MRSLQFVVVTCFGPLPVGACRLLAALVLLASPLSAQSDKGLQRTQSISLGKGWNAVFLEVEAVDTKPMKTFAGLPVDKVATLFENPVSNQFVSDSAIDLSKSSGWGIWYADDRPESFLGTLDSIHGNRAYLVHATEACTWKATGAVAMLQVDWKPDAYNFVGFPVKTPGGPSFAEFFAGSPAHQGQTIYRLVGGRWKKVIQPAAEFMRSGEAFWVFCDGRSDYQGPLRVETPSRRGLVLGRDPVELTLRNTCPHPIHPTIESVSSTGLPLSIVVRSYGSPTAPVASVGVPMPSGSWVQNLPPLEVAAGIATPFQLRLPEMLQAQQSSLLKITTDLGTEAWVPVRGFRDDLDD